MKPGWLAIGSGVAVGAACAALAAMPQIRSLEQRVGLPWLFQLRGPLEPPASVALVLMSEQAAANIQLSRDPEGFHRCDGLRVGSPDATHASLPGLPSRWPRCVHTKLLDKLAAGGARLAVFDVLFRQRPPLPGTDGDLHDWQDQELAAAAQRLPVVIAQKIEADAGSETTAELSAPIANAVLGSAPFPIVTEYGRRVDRFMAFKAEGLVTATLPAIALQAYLIDDYGALRDFLVRESQGMSDLLPRDARELVVQGEIQATTLLIRQIFRAEPSLAGKFPGGSGRASPNDIETGGAGRLVTMYGGVGTRLINLYGPAGTIPSYSYDEVLASPAATNVGRFSGRTIFIGFGEMARHEQVEHFATAYSSDDTVDLSGVEIAATAFANLLEDRTLRELPLAWWFGLTFFAGFFAYVTCARLGNRVALVVVGAGMFGYALVAQSLFEARELWVPVVLPMLTATPIGMLAAFGWKFWLAHVQRAKLRHAFGQFVPKEIVSALEQNVGAIGRSQESIECACVATDAANFTALAETMTPELLTEFLNRYFEALFGRVADRGGFVSDVVGDAMLAIWPHRATDTHVRLLHALVEMRDAAQQFNERLAGNKLMTRFGVDWGRVSLSTVGAHGHYEYRAVGDAVNTAARIQELNKKLGTRILLSEAAIGDGIGEFLLRDLGRFLLRGKRQSIHVYELFGSHARALPWEAELCAQFANGMQAVEQGNTDVARAQFKIIQMAHPDDGPTAFYVQQLGVAQARRAGAWVVD